MLISIILLLPIVAGGSALTYLIEREEVFLWRLAAGTVIGSAIYGTLVFMIGSLTGLTVAAPAALVLTLAPLLLFRDKTRSKALKADWRRASDKMQGRTRGHSISLAYYTFFFLLFCIFFSQAMFQTQAGIFTGGSQNLGDLPFHLGAIFSFTEANNLPPQNPSFAGAKFSYPFVADLVTAAFMKLGADVRGAMIAQDVAWAFSLLIVLERFVAKLTGERSAGKIASWLLFFSGGLGFIWFFADYWAQGKNFFSFLQSLPKDYTISDDFRWGNSLVTLFVTQRSLLLGMPLTIVVLQRLWEFFTTDSPRRREEIEAKTKKLPSDSQLRRFFSPFLIGVLAGMLPLVHLHSLAVLFVVTVFLFGLNTENWRIWIAFGAGVCLMAAPELAWSLTGSATSASEFIGWHFGWDHGESNVLWFWFKNTGLFIPLVASGLFLVLRRKHGDVSDDSSSKLWLFYTPFIFCFLIANLTKLAPWQWDNIKVLIYWSVGSLPFAAVAILWAWRRGSYLRSAAAVCFLALILSGALDVWRTVSGQIKTRVFDEDAIRIAEMIRTRTPANALFLNAATYNSAVVLTGRRSLMRYPGHLSSHGIEYRDRESDVKKMYQGGAAADALLTAYNIDYAIVSREETGSLNVDQAYFSRFPLVAESGTAHVYKIR